MVPMRSAFESTDGGGNLVNWTGQHGPKAWRSVEGLSILLASCRVWVAEVQGGGAVYGQSQICWSVSEFGELY